MSVLKSLRKAAVIRTCVGFIVIGLIFLAIGGFLLFAPQREMAQTTGVVTEINTFGTNEPEDWRYYIDYTAEGQTFTHVEFSCSSSVKVGDTVALEYVVGDPSHIQSPGAENLRFIVPVVGLVLIVIGIVLAVNAKKQSTRIQKTEAELAARGAEEPETELPPGEKSEYLFHVLSGAKQDCVLEDAQKRVWFEARAQRLPILTCPYDFTDHHAVRTVTHSIGPVISHEEGIADFGSEFAGRIVLDKTFEIDGADCREFLASLGYSMKAEMRGILPVFHLLRLGKEVGIIELTGTNAVTGKTGRLGNIPTATVLKVTCAESDIPGAFYACFCISRAFFVSE